MSPSARTGRCFLRLSLFGVRLLLLPSCGTGGKRHSGESPLVQPPRHVLAACRRSRLLRPACPTRLPSAAYPGTTPWAGVGGYLVYGAHVFNLQVGGEHLGHPEQDRPPRFLHVVIAAGNIE